MQLQLDGRHALVCGASQGIGRASAIELAALGASVTVLARRGEALEALAAELPRTHAAQRHGSIAVDVGDTAALRAQTAALVATAPVHILVNNSGGPPPGSVLDASP
ncbi:MAG TPA: SDR family NAD(P)-dependent oxidoreductase, partial [Rhodanobacter sp.]|nr:SDR family NAD(P)-dependent oxidoreductase [Rhodanobacter sp.]